jgi:hypothetical protein
MAAKTFAEWYSDFISDNRMVPEWSDVKAAIKIKEARPTVLAQRPVQHRQPAILREIMENLKSAMRKKDGSVFFQSSVSSETWEFFISAKLQAGA